MSSHHAQGTGVSAPSAPVGVLVVDDQLAVRQGVARLIASAQTALHCLGTAASGAEALSAAARLRPEVVVLDADLAGEDGLALIPQFALTASVLVLTCHGDAATRARATRLGARAFIEKHQPAADLLGAIARIGTQPAIRTGEEKTPPPSEASSHPEVAASSDAQPRQRS